MMAISEQMARTALKQVAGIAVDGWDMDFDFLDGAIDSLDHATFLLHLEEEYGLAVPEEDVALLNTIRSVVGYAKGKLG
jgi:acyl carrier protein